MHIHLHSLLCDLDPEAMENSNLLCLCYLPPTTILAIANIFYNFVYLIYTAMILSCFFRHRCWEKCTHSHGGGESFTHFLTH